MKSFKNKSGICDNKECSFYEKTYFSNCKNFLSTCTIGCRVFKREKSNCIGGLSVYSVYIDQLKTDKSESYNFRGTLNLPHLMNDAIKDNKNAFLAIGKDAAIIGISKRLNKNHLIEFRNMIHRNPDNELDYPFHIYVIDKKLVSKVLPFLQKVTPLIMKDIRKIERKLYKDKKAGKFSNQPLKKVMVF